MRYTLENMPFVNLRRHLGRNDPYRQFFLSMTFDGRLFTSSMTPINLENPMGFLDYEKSTYYLKHKEEILSMFNNTIQIYEDFLKKVRSDRKLRNVRNRNV